jgi:hypothetical protein
MKRVGHEQLIFAFADRPQGGNHLKETKEWLRHIANSKKLRSSTAKAKPYKMELLEQVASLPNMAMALLNVARNKGVAGVDGRSVDEVVSNAKSLMSKLQYIQP